MTEKMEMTSMDIAAQRRAVLKSLFPSVFTETKDEKGKLVESIDFEKLKAQLGTFSDVFESRRERYGMDWPGKKDSIKLIQQSSIGTLKPCREESLNFESTNNLFIEGDNLEVLKLLQKSYFGKIKMIYIDPPYNTGREFIYPDNYSETLDTYLAYSGQVDSGGRKFGTNTESSGRFHTRWLNMMYPRIYLSRNLLREDGVAFISIGEDEVANLISLCNELYGDDNLVTICSRVMKTGGQKGVHFSPSVDYVLVYAKNIAELDQFREQIGQKVIDTVYTKVEVDGPRKGEKYRSMGLYQAMLDKRANQRFYIKCPDGQLVIPPGDSFPIVASEGEQIKPGDGDGVWRWTYSRFKEERDAGNIEFIKSDRTSLVLPNGSQASWNVYYKIWLSDRMQDGQLPGNILDKFESRHSSAELKQLSIPFDFAKPSALIKYFMDLSGVASGDIVLDFFAGSASTGHAAMEMAVETGQPHPFICVQLPEPTGESSEEARQGFKTIAEIAKERLRRVAAKLGAGLLKESADLGFRVFKLSPSAFVPWNATTTEMSRDELIRQLELHIDHILDDAEPEDLLYELLLKAGFQPSGKVETANYAGRALFSIANGSLLICLDGEITPDLIDAVAEAEPMQFICLDKAFKGNDQLKANAVQTFAARNQGRDKADQIIFRTV